MGVQVICFIVLALLKNLGSQQKIQKTTTLHNNTTTIQKNVKWISSSSFVLFFCLLGGHHQCQTQNCRKVLQKRERIWDCGKLEMTAAHEIGRNCENIMSVITLMASFCSFFCALVDILQNTVLKRLLKDKSWASQAMTFCVYLVHFWHFEERHNPINIRYRHLRHLWCSESLLLIYKVPMAHSVALIQNWNPLYLLL